MLKEIEKLFSPERGFWAYRNLVSTIKPPAIPYLGFLRDLVKIDERNHDLHLNKINIQKRQLTCRVIREMEQFQKTTSFPFQEDPIVMECFRNLNTIDSEQLYQLSLQIEPRRMRNFKL